MKTKKFLILAILTIMVAILFTGCEYDLTKEYESVKNVAKDFLSTKGYEIPKRYAIKYVDENRFSVTYNKDEMVFYISRDKPQIISITDSKAITINQKMIEECKEIANDFLNTAGYQMPEGTKRIEYSEDNNQLKVTRVYKIDTGEIKKANGEKCIEITITFDIKDDLEIVGIGYYVDESEGFAPVILMVDVIIALAICNALDNAIKKQTKNKKR